MKKFFLDLLPVILFFVVYQKFGVYTATAAAVATGVLQVAYMRLRYGRYDTMQLVTVGILVVLGGATLWLHNPLFIKWKPTAVYGVFALVFLGSRWFMGRFLTQRLLGAHMTLPAPVWQTLDNAWIGFFIFLGVLNIYVAYHFDTDTWVKFKLFGILGLLLSFMVLQGIYLSKHLPTSESKKHD